MGCAVVHWELWSKDPARVSDFYRKVFDWDIQHVPEMNYRMVETGGAGGINGGIMQPDRSGPWPGNMSFYINVDDLAAYRRKIVAAGGKVVVEEQEVPGMGSFSLFSDPDGRVMGIWKVSAVT
jgi:predicted enzyme related to lactoylglutathione lyase